MNRIEICTLSVGVIPAALAIWEFLCHFAVCRLDIPAHMFGWGGQQLWLVED